MPANDRADNQACLSRLMIKVGHQGWLPTLMLDVDVDACQGRTDTSRARRLGLCALAQGRAEFGKRTKLTPKKEANV
jgi:hypothetical protein